MSDTMKNIFFLLLLCAGLPAAADSNLPLIEQGDLPGWKIEETRFFKQKELYGHINGGSELYLEFGFRELAVQYLMKENAELTVEIYQMSDPAAAFGIFSLSRRNCPPLDSISEFNCVTPYQTAFAAGDCYVSVTNYDGTDRQIRNSVAAAQLILKKIDDENYRLPPLFLAEPLREHLPDLKLMEGKLGLENGFSQWSELFSGFSRFSVAVLPLQRDAEWASVAVIQFRSPEDTGRFLTRAGFSGDLLRESNWQTTGSPETWRAVRATADSSLVFIETSPAYPHKSALLDKLGN